MSRHRAKLKRVLYLPFLALLLSNFGTLMAGALNPQHLSPAVPLPSLPATPGEVDIWELLTLSLCIYGQGGLATK